MRRAAISTFLFVAILGLGCMGVAVPGKADEHCNENNPQYDPSDCTEKELIQQNELTNQTNEIDEDKRSDYER